MIETKKLSRPEACAELARRIGRNVAESPYSGLGIELAPGLMASLPDFFTDRNAAAELVAWLREQGRGDIWALFVANLLGENHFIDRNDMAANLMLATPEQITLAACAALNIELATNPPICPECAGSHEAKYCDMSGE